MIPTFNNLAQLDTCLRHLDRQSRRDFRAIVCVDGSTDGTSEDLTTSMWSFELVVLEHPDGANRGRASARNLALGQLQAPLTCFLDSDMYLDPEALEAPCRPCSIAGAVRRSGQFASLNAGTSRWARYLATRGTNRYPDGAMLPFNQFVTANVALHTDDVLRLGGFDESLTLYGGEDRSSGIASRASGYPSSSIVLPRRRQSRTRRWTSP